MNADGTLVFGYADFNGGTSYPRAVLWTKAGMEYLAGDNGLHSRAYDATSDFSTAVGWQDRSIGSSESQAFYWTRADGMILLPDSGISSSANGISDDGAIIVGSEGAPGSTVPVYWDASRTLHTLTLGQHNGQNNSLGMAYDVSGDGSTIVGYVQAASFEHLGAIWRGGAISYMPSLGGTYSYASRVNQDGSVIVGNAEDAAGYRYAVRYTDAGGTVSLGHLGGEDSYASAVSADGSVVVGASLNGDVVDPMLLGFRWTSETGMQSIEDWLRDSGVTVGQDFAEQAYGVSADGKIIVGVTHDKKAYIARVSSGAIVLDDYYRSIGDNSVMRAGLQSASLALNSTEPLRDLLDPGRHSFTVMSDIGRGKASEDTGDIAVGYLRYSYGTEFGTLRMVAGANYFDQDLAAGGFFRRDGFFVAPEATFNLTNDLFLTASAYYSAEDISIHREYLNASNLVFSNGETDSKTWGAKLRLDWRNAVEAGTWGFTPYGILSYAHSKIDGYHETGGGFPARFDARSEHSTVARIGLDAVGEVQKGIRLLAKAELAYQLEDKGSATTGEITGINSFNMAGAEHSQFWARGAVGLEADVAKGSLFLNANVATDGSDPNYWVKSGWRVAF